MGKSQIAKPQPSTDAKKDKTKLKKIDKPVIKKSSDKPVIKKSADKPVIKKSADKPVIKKSADKPVIKKSADKPVIKKSLDKPVIKKSSKAKNQFTEKEEISFSQGLGMKDSDVAELKKKTNKIEKQKEEEQKMQVEESTVEQEEVEETEGLVQEKVKVKRKESVLKSKTKSKEDSFLSISNPKEDNKKFPRDEAYWGQHGVVLLSHIPHGFFEKEMQGFFGQFGRVTNLRLGRSHKTGRSKCYALIEFRYAEVADIVAESMNNYLMFDKIMKCKVIPREECGPKMFYGKINPEFPPGVKKRNNVKRIHNSIKSDERNESRKKEQVEKLNKMEAKLAKKGIAFKIPLS